MKSRRGYSFALVVAVLALATACSGCAQQMEWLRKPRQWDGCTVAGAVLGAAAGAASGIVIATRPRHAEASNNTKVAGGVIGMAVGSIIGGLAGHFICDPVIPPPPPPQVAQAPPPLPPPPPPPPPPKEKMVLRGVHFDFDKSNIRADSEPILDEAAEALRAHSNLTVDVDGYCDEVGTVEYNLRLSDRRAAAVVKYLAGKGIAADRLIPHGFGKTNFVAPNDTDEGRAQNRRVELVPIGQ